MALSRFEETPYEGYGPGGTAVLVEVMTDNRNRTVSDVRSIFTKCNGNMGESGCVSWLFDKKGLLVYPKSTDFDKLFEASIEAGADVVLVSAACRPSFSALVTRWLSCVENSAIENGS